MCVRTRDVGVFFSVKSQFVLCWQVDEGLHGGEVGDVSVADLTEQRLQIPAHTHTHAAETHRGIFLNETVIMLLNVILIHLRGGDFCAHSRSRYHNSEHSEQLLDTKLHQF